jgi:hypothetical protein
MAINIKMQSTARSISFPPSDETNFGKVFKKIIIDGNEYYCLSNTENTIRKALKKHDTVKYNLTYFPLITGFKNWDSKAVFENDKHIIVPLVVNVNVDWNHDDGDINEEAGAFNCAKPVEDNNVYEIYIKSSPLPDSKQKKVNQEGFIFTGTNYLIPLLLPNFSILYIATPNLEALKLYQEKVNKALSEAAQEYFIGIDNEPIAIDSWHCSVSIFNIVEGRNALDGIRFKTKL